MNKLTLKIEYSDFLNDDITNYLTSLNGVKLVTIKNDENEIYVEYDSSIISLKLLKMEILLYLDIAKVPSIVAFDKHLKKNIKEEHIIIKDLCCEYCLNGMIDDLLEIDGIISAYSDFDYNNKYDVNIFVTYDEKMIDKNKILELEVKFNSY